MNWIWIGYHCNEDEVIFCKLTDREFDKVEGASLMTCWYDEPYAELFSGCGYSTAQYKMKCIVRNEVLYVRDPNQDISDIRNGQLARFVPAPMREVPGWETRIQPHSLPDWFTV